MLASFCMVPWVFGSRLMYFLHPRCIPSCFPSETDGSDFLWHLPSDLLPNLPIFWQLLALSKKSRLPDSQVSGYKLATRQGEESFSLSLRYAPHRATNKGMGQLCTVKSQGKSWDWDLSLGALGWGLGLCISYKFPGDMLLLVLVEWVSRMHLCTGNMIWACISILCERYLCVCVCIPAHISVQEWAYRGGQRTVHLLFWDWFFCWPRTHHIGQDGWLVSPGDLIYPSSTEMTNIPPHIGYFMWCQVSN